MKKVLVIGSINVDHIINVEKLPLPGETIMGKNTNIVGGGKGANQAVAFSRLGSNVCMLACVGDDQDAKFVLGELSKNNIDISRIKKTNIKTGMASIMVSSDGQNSIVVIPGANYDVTKQYIDENVDKIKESEYIVLQNEIPIETIEYCLLLAKKYNKITVYNNAPAMKIDEKLYEHIDYLVVNETELNHLCSDYNQLFEKGIEKIILTLGDKGSEYLTKDSKIFVPALKVKAIDTVAAGDTYIGALFSKYDGTNMKQAMEFASKASSVAVTRVGAQSSIPYIDEV